MKFFLNFLNCIKMIMRLKKLFYNFVKILLVCTACTHSFPFAPLNAWINFWTVTHFQIQNRLIFDFLIHTKRGKKCYLAIYTGVWTMNIVKKISSKCISWKGAYIEWFVFYWVFWKQWKYWVTKLKENWYCALTYKRCVNVSST